MDIIPQKPDKPGKPQNTYSGRTSLDGLIAQLRSHTNVVTQSVLVDCIIDRLQRGEYD